MQRRFGLFLAAALVRRAPAQRLQQRRAHSHPGPVEDQVIVELKAVKALAPEHQAQVINYLKATGIEVGLLLASQT